MRTIDDVIPEIAREVGRRLQGCTLSPAQGERLKSLIGIELHYVVHDGVLDPIVPKQENGPESEALSR